MGDEISHLSFEASGKGAVKSVINHLKDHAENGQFDRVYVELGTHPQDRRTQVRQKSVMDFTSGEHDEERPRGIRAQTSHHVILSGLSEFEGEMPVSTRKVLEVVDMPEGTAYAAMSELHDRELVERTEEKNENNSYEYRLTPAGRSELDRLGVINNNGK
jgi:predicted transcriptional regulator